MIMVSTSQTPRELLDGGRGGTGNSSNIDELTNEQAHLEIEKLRRLYLVTHPARPSCPRSKAKFDIKAPALNEYCSANAVDLEQLYPDEQTRDKIHSLFFCGCRITIEHSQTLHSRQLRFMAVLNEHIDVCRRRDLIWMQWLATQPARASTGCHLLQEWSTQLDWLQQCAKAVHDAARLQQREQSRLRWSGQPVKVKGGLLLPTVEQELVALTGGRHAYSLLADDVHELTLNIKLVAQLYNVTFSVPSSQPLSSMRVQLASALQLSTAQQQRLSQQVGLDCLAAPPIHTLLYRRILPLIVQQVFGGNALVCDDQFFPLPVEKEEQQQRDIQCMAQPDCDVVAEEDIVLSPSDAAETHQAKAADPDNSLNAGHDFGRDDSKQKCDNIIGSELELQLMSSDTDESFKDANATAKSDSELSASSTHEQEQPKSPHHKTFVETLRAGWKHFLPGHKKAKSEEKGDKMNR